MAVNDVEHKGKTSFINDGPLAKLDKRSRFKPTVFIDFHTILSAMPEIESRLGRIKRQRRQRVDVSDYKKLKQERPKIWLFYIHDLIYFFSPITHSELITLLKLFYGDNNYSLTTELALLDTLGLTSTLADIYYVSMPSVRTTFFAFEGINRTKFRAKVLSFYFKRDRVRFRLLHNRVGYS